MIKAQPMRRLILIITIGLLIPDLKAQQPEPLKIISRKYCTEIGRFDLIFDEDEISGSYALLHKKSLGSIWGKLEGNKAVGRWIDQDGTGDIIIEFNTDFSWFTTSYRNDEHPETWYRDQWHGQLRPGDQPTFSINDKTYRCE